MRLIFVIGIFLICQQSIAQTDLAAPYKSKCSEGTQLDMNLCLEKERKAVDARLEREVQVLLKSLAEPVYAKRAQDSWRKFRLHECAYELSGLSTIQGGSLRPYASDACYINLAEKRLIDIKRHQAESCGGCPVKK